jgi:hypothetical protein
MSVMFERTGKSKSEMNEDWRSRTCWRKESRTIEEISYSYISGSDYTENLLEDRTSYFD